MRVFSFSAESGEIGIGVETSKGIFNLTKAFDLYQNAKRVKQPIVLSFLQVMIELEYFSSQIIHKILNDPWVQSKSEMIKLQSDFHYDLPVARPSKIICIGNNYQSHAEELKYEIPEELLFFPKAPSSLIPHDAEIIIPHWIESRVDHEAELAFIIGKTCKNLNPDEAFSSVAGYTILNDVTAREMQKKDIDLKHPWFRSKSIDTFCPIGPYLIPADTVPDPHNLEIRLTVNGKECQYAKTSSMIFKIPEIISNISKFMTLYPGDIIATGTPEGVTPVMNGDIIEISITGFGTLRNRVVKELKE
jgi:2-keto-4-pentenoate hydratase/2-oxohepta-3-ene-1,7-dioic acid hydratase in catechol pathway